MAKVGDDSKDLSNDISAKYRWSQQVCLSPGTLRKDGAKSRGQASRPQGESNIFGRREAVTMAALWI